MLLLLLLCGAAIALVVAPAIRINSGTAREEQALQMVAAIAEAAKPVPAAPAWIRARLEKAKPRELGTMVEHIDLWGTHRDTSLLEALAKDHPGTAGFLRDRAAAIRKARRPYAWTRRKPRGSGRPTARSVPSRDTDSTGTGERDGVLFV